MYSSDSLLIPDQFPAWNRKVKVNILLSLSLSQKICMCEVCKSANLTNVSFGTVHLIIQRENVPACVAIMLL